MSLDSTPAMPDAAVLATELLRARFGSLAAALDADVDVLGTLVEALRIFTPGRVPPGADALDVQGLAVAPASVDRALARKVDLPTRRWPGGAQAAVIITHDVDAFDGLSYFPLRAAGWVANGARALARRDRAGLSRTARRAARWTGWWVRGHDPVADFDRWLQVESHHGLRSTFFFMALEHAVSREGRMYRVDDPRVRRVMRTAVHGGWEVGLHASRFGSDTAEGLETQRLRLEAAVDRPVRAVRYHYLGAQMPDGWRHMRRAGFDISSNVGFHPPWQGFRTGTSWPHRPLGRAGPWEVPMALMDAAHGPAAGRLVPVFDRLLAEARDVGGALVINFHTNYRADVDAPGVHRAFETIVERIARAADAGHVAPLTLGQAVDHVAGALVD